MVAEPTSALTPLSPTDAALFERYIAAGSLQALAESLKQNPISPIGPMGPIGPIPPPNDAPTSGPTSIPPPHPPLPPPHSLPALYLWSAQPHIAAWIAFHEYQLHLADQREMRNYLKEVAKTATNPVERRRAATTIFRAAPGGVPVGNTRQVGASPGGTPLRGVRNSHSSPNTATPPSPTPSTPPPNPNAPFSQSSNLLAPSATPTAEHTDQAVADLILTLFREPRDKRNHATLRAFCTPRTLFAGMRVPMDADAFSQRAADFLCHHSWPSVASLSLARAEPAPTAETQSVFRLTVRHTNQDLRHFKLELARPSPADPWLIASISKNPSG